MLDKLFENLLFKNWYEIELNLVKERLTFNFSHTIFFTKSRSRRLELKDKQKKTIYFC
jgi:hypothetical protein